MKTQLEERYTRVLRWGPEALEGIAGNEIIELLEYAQREKKKVEELSFRWLNSLTPDFVCPEGVQEDKLFEWFCNRQPDYRYADEVINTINRRRVKVAKGKQPAAENEEKKKLEDFFNEGAKHHAPIIADYLKEHYKDCGGGAGLAIFWTILQEKGIARPTDSAGKTKNLTDLHKTLEALLGNIGGYDSLRKQLNANRGVYISKKGGKLQSDDPSASAIIDDLNEILT
jgi:hypothetical protein